MSVHIGIWGDSVIEGFKDNEMGGWANRLQAYFMGKDDYSIINVRGSGGETSERLLKRFNVEAEAIYGPHIVIFAVGKNDSAEVMNIGIENFELNLKRLVEEARRFTNNILFVGIGNVDESKVSPFPKGRKPYYFNKKIEEYNLVIEKVCKKGDLKLVSVYGKLDINEDFFDGLHPNALGHEKIFRIVSPAVEEMIEEIEK